MKKFLVIQTNTDGRPCGWGLSVDKMLASETAEHQWKLHGHPSGSGCYPGEERGELVVHEVEEADTSPNDDALADDGGNS